MKRSILLLFGFLILAAGRPGTAAADRGAFVIHDFRTDLTVDPDAGLTVVERIVVDFSAPRHGIYRTIPVHYTDGKGFAYSMHFHLRDVVDGAGTPQKVKVTSRGKYVNLRIGDASHTVNGRVTYVIRYGVEDALGSFPEHDEIYWNATGHEWNTRIEHASARVHLPAPLPADSLEVASYAGRFGARDRSASVAYPEPGTVDFNLAGALGPLEGLTVAVGWPKGYVRYPGTAARVASFLGDNWILLFPFGFLAFLWRRYRRGGRDPEGPVSVVVRYEPPKGVTAGEIGTLLDERVDLRDLTAVIIDLAVRGYLVIREEEHTILFSWLKSKQTIFERKRDKPDADLLPHERKILDGIFASGDVVASSELKQKFYKNIPGIKDSLYDRLTRGGYFAGSPESVRNRFRGLGILAAIATAGLGLWTAGARGGVFPQAGVVPVLAGVVALVLFLLFAPAMPRRTKAGVEMRDWALGFKEFVDRVERPNLNADEARNVFEALLPYAMALGVSTAWARRFEGIYQGHPPTWYVGPGTGTSFSTLAFEQSLASSMRQVGQQMTASPRSSSGSGGGGFSGGGGGGGGGGSW